MHPDMCHGTTKEKRVDWMVDLESDWKNEVLNVFADEGKLRAIKFIRIKLGLSLYNAKIIIDQLLEDEVKKQVNDIPKGFRDMVRKQLGKEVS